MGDQAIQGPGSVRFSEKERVLEGLPPDPLSEGVCLFHISDCVGVRVDKQYNETFVFDRLLRLLRRQFGFGTGHLIFRGVASRFCELVKEFEEKEREALLAAANAEAKGQPLAARRLRLSASKAAGEAAAIRRVHWDTWKKPMAPRVDGTRKAVYHNKARSQFFDTFGLAYWGLQVRMQEALESARHVCVQNGRAVTNRTGLRTQTIRSLRSLGRAMLDIRVITFNLGRVDFRKKHLAAYALECQVSLNSMHCEQAYAYSQSMFAAVGALVEMHGIVKMVGQLSTGCVFEKHGSRGVITNKKHGPWSQAAGSKTSTLWALCRTFLNHRCWRLFPQLALKLPEVLLGGSFNGCKLQSDVFQEPEDTLAVGKWHGKYARGAARLQERFWLVLQSLTRLRQWAQLERREFLARVVGIGQSSSKRVRVEQGLDMGLPKLDDIVVGEGLDVAMFKDEDEEDHGNAQVKDTDRGQRKPAVGGSEAPAPARSPAVGGSAKRAKGDSTTPRCSFVKPPARKEQEHNNKAILVDLMADSILPAATVADAAFELDVECERLGPRFSGLTAADISTVLSGATSSTAAAEGIPTEISSGSESDECDEDRADNGQPPQPSEPRSATPLQHRPDGDTRVSECLKWFREQPRINWIMTRDLQQGCVTIRKMDCYVKAWKEKFQTKLRPREKFILQVGRLFDQELFGTSSLESLRHPLEALHDACTERIWGLPKLHLPYKLESVMKDPPNEVYRKISLDNLTKQFHGLRLWVQSMQHLPYGHEFYEPVAFQVRRLGLDDKPVGLAFLITGKGLSGLSGQNNWPYRFVPRLPVKALSKEYGALQVLHVERKPDVMRFYQHVMSSSLREIQCRDMWNIVMGWHFYVHAATSSESLAECVGSMLAATRRHNINGKLSIRHIVWSTQLRATGLSGCTGEEGVMALALNTYFQSEGPQGWHFQAARKNTNRECVRRAEVKNKVRLLNRPAWFSSLLQDLLCTKQLHLCKALPRPEDFILSREEKAVSRWQHQTRSAKRALVVASAEEQMNPKTLPKELWQHMKIGQLVVPSCLRPGKRPR